MLDQTKVNPVLQQEEIDAFDALGESQTRL